MRNYRRFSGLIFLCLFVFFASGTVRAGQVIGFEVSEGFTVGGPMPSGWSASSSSGGAAGISTNYPVSGSQSLMACAGYVEYWPNYPVGTGGKVCIQIDIRPSDYNPPNEFNFSGYGGVYFYNQDYCWAGGLIFKLEDYDGYSPASADDFKITFLNNSSQELIGYFARGTYYRYTLTIDRSAGKCSSRLDVLGGGMVAERTYNNNVSSIPYIYFAGSQTPSTPVYYDQLVFYQIVPADFVYPPGVNMVDFAVLAEAWQSSTGQANWNGLCDLHQDGQIDFKDLGIFLNYWLE